MAARARRLRRAGCRHALPALPAAADAQAVTGLLDALAAGARRGRFSRSAGARRSRDASRLNWDPQSCAADAARNLDILRAHRQKLVRQAQGKASRSDWRGPGNCPQRLPTTTNVSVCRCRCRPAMPKRHARQLGRATCRARTRLQPSASIFFAVAPQPSASTCSPASAPTSTASSNATRPHALAWEVLTCYSGLHAVIAAPGRRTGLLDACDFKWLGRFVSQLSRWLHRHRNPPGRQVVGERRVLRSRDGRGGRRDGRRSATAARSIRA